MTNKSAYMKKWHAEHLEEEKKYRAERKEKDSEIRKNNYWRDIESTRKKQRDYYAANIEKKKKYNAEYEDKTKDKRLKALRDARAMAKSEAFSAMGGKCAVCGFDDYRALQVDHVNSDGAIMRKAGEFPGSTKFYRVVRASVENGEGVYQLLCCNHNWIKRHEMMESNQHTIKYDKSSVATIEARGG